MISPALSETTGSAEEQCNQRQGSLLSESVCQLPHYDKNQPPSKPVIIDTELSLVDLSDLNENRMTATMKMTLTMFWNETRLVPVGNWSEAWTFRSAHSRAMTKIWLPEFHYNKLIRIESMHSIITITIMISISKLNYSNLFSGPCG